MAHRDKQAEVASNFELPNAYVTVDHTGRSIIAIPSDASIDGARFVRDASNQLYFQATLPSADVPKTHKVRNALLWGTIGSVVTAVFTTGIAQPLIESGKNFLGLNPTIPGRSAGPVAGAGQETPTPKPTVSTTPTASATTTTEAKKTPEQCVADFSTKQLIGSTLLVSMRPSKDEKNLTELSRLFNDYSVGGIVIARGTLDKDYRTTNKTLTDFKNAQDIPLLVGVTQEGGSVKNRVPLPKGINKMPSQPEVGKMNDTQLQALEKTLDTIYADLAAHGINMVFGPVVDVGDPYKNGPMKYRMFSKDPETAAKLALIYAKAAEKYNVLDIYKHAFGLSTAKFYPGYDGTGNSDQWPMYTMLDKTALIPYQVAKSQENVGVMMGAQSIIGLTVKDTSTQMPAMFSKPAVDAVKQAMKPDKSRFIYIVTDDIRTLSTIKAGLDVPHAVMAAISAGVHGVEIGVPMKGQGWKGTFDKIIALANEDFTANPSLRKQIQEQVLGTLLMKKVDPCMVIKE